MRLSTAALVLLSSSSQSLSALAFECTASAFAAILPSDATINYAVPVAANGSFGGGSADLEFPTNDTGLPALCAIAVNVKSSNTSSYNFGMFLPQKWNSRIITSGNGGLGGGINWNDMGSNVFQGFATASTDTGHISESGDPTWAINNTEAQLDWGYRAMHGTVVHAKAITEKYYNNTIKYSYYSACSTGGRQGFKEIQEYPEDFDGVLAGAPAWWTTHLQTWTQQLGLWNLPTNAPHHIPSSLFPIISSEVFRQCDPQDGLVDNIISDPVGCNFFPEALLCTPTSNTSACLTAPQLSTLYKIYNPWVDANDTFVFPHLELGSEGQWDVLVNTDAGEQAESGLGASWTAAFLYNLTYDQYNFWNFSYATVQLADALNPANATADAFDISPFAARGGKLIHYHGLSDGLIPTGSSIYYYKQALQAMIPRGIDVSSFYKFYLIPGMQHCKASVHDAPWYINGGNQAFALGSTVSSVPGFEDARHDALMALMQWVEEGTAPEEIVATKWEDDDVGKGVVRQRPLCPYPRQARWDGMGDPDAAESWRCEGVSYVI